MSYGRHRGVIKGNVVLRLKLSVVIRNDSISEGDNSMQSLSDGISRVFSIEMSLIGLNVLVNGTLTLCTIPAI